MRTSRRLLARRDAGETVVHARIDGGVALAEVDLAGAEPPPAELLVVGERELALSVALRTVTVVDDALVLVLAPRLGPVDAGLDEATLTVAAHGRPGAERAPRQRAGRCADGRAMGRAVHRPALARPARRPRPRRRPATRQGAVAARRGVRRGRRPRRGDADRARPRRCRGPARGAGRRHPDAPTDLAAPDRPHDRGGFACTPRPSRRPPARRPPAPCSWWTAPRSAATGLDLRGRWLGSAAGRSPRAPGRRGRDDPARAPDRGRARGPRRRMGRDPAARHVAPSGGRLRDVVVGVARPAGASSRSCTTQDGCGSV